MSVETLRRLMNSAVGGGIPAVVLIHIVLSFVSNGFLGFYPTYLIEVKGFSPQMVAIQPLTGMCRDRFGSRWTITFVAGMVFLGLVALQVGQSVIQIVLLTALIRYRNGLGVVTNTFIADHLRPISKARDSDCSAPPGSSWARRAPSSWGFSATSGSSTSHS